MAHSKPYEIERTSHELEEIGVSQMGWICHIVNPNLIFVHLRKHHDLGKFKTVKSGVDIFDLSPIKNPTVGMTGIMLDWDTTEFHRAKIITIDRQLTEMEVQLIDYGITTHIVQEDMFYGTNHEGFRHTEPLAIACSLGLNAPGRDPNHWPDESYAEIRLLLNRPVIIKVLDLATATNPPIVRILDDSFNPIDSLITHHGFIVPSEIRSRSHEHFNTSTPLAFPRIRFRSEKTLLNCSF